MNDERSFRDVLRIDAAEVTDRVGTTIRAALGRWKKRGLVVAVSGGVDSSCVAALAARALGPGRVLGLLMPERDSSPDSLRLGKLLVETLGIPSIVEDISGVLDVVGCYERRDAAVRSVVPGFGPGHRCKIVLPGILDRDRYRVFSVVTESPSGERNRVRLTPEAYLAIVAATNFKQRTRKMLEYYHADRLNYAVAGTPNRLEYDQGFFVKLGDGSADLKPIAHLYKTQVYALAESLGVPREIREQPPTTDTYSLEQSQEEFYFSVPYHVLDLCLYGRDHNVSAELVSAAVDLTPDQVERVYRDIENKRRSTAYLHAPPVVVEDPR